MKKISQFDWPTGNNANLYFEMTLSLPSPLSLLKLGLNRELKQRERHKFAYLVGKNNSFARPARAFFTFVHFFAVVSKTTA